MAPSPLASDPGERYAELERAYTEDRWPDVLRAGGQLIADLSNDPDPVSADLACRAHLLLGHAHLYGLRDPDSARPHYAAVLNGPATADLRRIAEEALPFCQPAEEPAPPPVEELRADAVDLGTAAAAAAAAAGAPAVIEDPASWSTVETAAEPLGDSIHDSEGRWIPRAGTAAEAVTGAATPWLEAPIQESEAISLEKTNANVGGGALTAGGREMPPSLEVEVVEEPELVEVAQADPSLAEELELELTRIRERRAARRGEAGLTTDLEAQVPAASAAFEEPDDLMRDPELLAGLLRVVVTP